MNEETASDGSVYDAETGVVISSNYLPAQKEALQINSKPSSEVQIRRKAKLANTPIIIGK